jgi:hypothetical protein
MVLNIPRIGVLLACLLTGCLASQPALRVPAGTPVAVVVTLGSHDGRGHAFPTSVRDAITAELVARGFAPLFIEDGVGENARNSSISNLEVYGRDARFAKIAATAPEVSWVLVVDASVRFFSQLTGRFRWDVGLDMQLARRDRLDEVARVSVAVPAFLQYAHEREPEAVVFVRRQLLTELGGLIDAAVSYPEAGGRP